MSHCRYSDLNLLLLSESDWSKHVSLQVFWPPLVTAQWKWLISTCLTAGILTTTCYSPLKVIDLSMSHCRYSDHNLLLSFESDWSQPVSLQVFWPQLVTPQWKWLTQTCLIAGILTTAWYYSVKVIDLNLSHCRYSDHSLLLPSESDWPQHVSLQVFWPQLVTPQWKWLISICLTAGILTTACYSPVKVIDLSLSHCRYSDHSLLLPSESDWISACLTAGILTTACYSPVKVIDLNMSPCRYSDHSLLLPSESDWSQPVSLQVFWPQLVTSQWKWLISICLTTGILITACYSPVKVIELNMSHCRYSDHSLLLPSESDWSQYVSLQVFWPQLVTPQWKWLISICLTTVKLWSEYLTTGILITACYSPVKVIDLSLSHCRFSDHSLLLPSESDWPQHVSLQVFWPQLLLPSESDWSQPVTLQVFWPQLVTPQWKWLISACLTAGILTTACYSSVKVIDLSMSHCRYSDHSLLLLSESDWSKHVSLQVFWPQPVTAQWKWLTPTCLIAGILTTTCYSPVKVIDLNMSHYRYSDHSLLLLSESGWSQHVSLQVFWSQLVTPQWKWSISTCLTAGIQTTTCYSPVKVVDLNMSHYSILTTTCYSPVKVIDLNMSHYRYSDHNL